MQTQNKPVAKYILSTLPDTVYLKKQQNIYEDRDSMIYDILDNIQDYPGSKVFGGFHRDFFAKMPFKDIDIRFKFKTEATFFIERMQKKYNIKFMKPSYKSNGCYTICVQSKSNSEVNIYLDVSYKRDVNGSIYKKKFFDFDVNMLSSQVHYSDRWYLRYLNTINPHCQILDILDNCARKQFIVLNYNGKSEILHKPSYTAIIDSNGRIIRMKRNLSSCGSFMSKIMDSDCINYHTIRGKKLLLRKKKMESRGWTCLNEECSNPVCILAPESLRNKYKEYVQEIKLQRLKRAEEKLKKAEEKIRARELSRQKKDREIKSFGYIPGLISRKMVRKNQYSKSIEAKEIHLAKKSFLKKLKEEELICGKTRKKYRSKRSGKNRYDF
uniref:NT pol-beta-like superfamily protein n=1 Tax=Borely moumouvirus TaxID=2712067 RepID=A0A6G6ADU5_9VIRU